MYQSNLSKRWYLPLVEGVGSLQSFGRSLGHLGLCRRAEAGRRSVQSATSDNSVISQCCASVRSDFFPFLKYSSCTVPIRTWSSYRSHLVGRHQSDLRTQLSCRYKRCRRRMRLWVGVFALIISSLYSTFGLDCVSSKISGKPAIDCDGSSDAWVFMLLVISTLLFS